MATFYGIGVGPGNSDLITVRAVNTIKAIDVLYAPKAKENQASLAEKIAAPYFDESLIIKRRHFPMTNDLAEKQAQWQKIVAEIKQDLENDLNVGFITLGDPSIYSTYSYLVNLMNHEQIDIQTIAGISSFSQLGASISVPLTLDNELLEIIPANASEEAMAQAIDFNDNLIIMKISTNLPMVYKLLKERNLLDKAIVISNISMKQQKAYCLTELEPEAKLPYFSTLLVKKNFEF